MTQEQAAKRIEELIKEIHYHDYLYYVKGEPEISDEAYDALVLELKRLEERFPQLRRPDSPTQRVGGTISKTFPVFRHKTPMLSLDNAYSLEELQAFHERILKTLGHENFTYIAQLKIDGVSLSVHYQQGILYEGVTRGDGIQGDAITPNVKTIKSLPLSIHPFTQHFPNYFEVRGEVYMTNQRFEMLNKEREKQGLSPFMNPRNATAGTLKLQDAAEVARRHLQFWAYQLINYDESFSLPDSDYEQMQLLRQWGFPTMPYDRHCKTLEEVQQYIAYWSEHRHELDFQIDGIVIKVNEHSLRAVLGETSKGPRWAIAYKFPAEKAITQLQDVVFQVGRTGFITPVAQLKPVLIAGTIVKRASLYNFDEIKRLGLRLKDTVEVIKSGEIIPKIVRVVAHAPDGKPIEIPEKCPVCGATLEHPEGEVGYYCPNIECLAQRIARLEHFASRKAMNIEGLGTQIIKQLVAHELVKVPADLYELKVEDLLPLERFAEKSAQNLIQAIERSKQVPYPRVLYALGIRHVGEVVAKLLAQHFPSIEQLRAASIEDLENIPEIGPVIARSVFNYLHTPENWRHIVRLQAHGLQLQWEPPQQPQDQPLKGLKVLVTGTLPNMSREEVKTWLTSLGATYASSVSKQLDVLIVGDKPGASKIKKAQQWGIPMLSLEEFKKQYLG